MSATELAVVCVDDQRTFRDALQAAVRAEPGMRCAGGVETVAEAMAILACEPVDVVLMDFDLADVDGIEGARRIKTAHPGVRVLLLTGLADLDLLVRAVAAQVDAFLTKDTPLEQLLEAIRGDGDGGLVLDAASIEALRRRVGDVATIGGRRWLPALTAREKEVLALLEAGVEPKSIAAQLGIRLHTCRGYVRNVLVKLGAHSQLEAVAVAKRAGLLS
jgi:DNA-binding NarL/FixJ family response regulator